MERVPDHGDDMSDGVWLTVSEIARRKGVSHQAVSKRVKSLEADGKVIPKREGKKTLVDLVEYDRAVGDFGDATREAAAETVRASKEAAPATKASQLPDGMRDAQLERVRYEARMKALDYAERTGQLVPVSGPGGVEDAMVMAAEKILSVLDLMLRATPGIVAAAREGEPAARREIKKVIHAQRMAIGEAMLLLADEGRKIETDGGLTAEIDVDLLQGMI
jgi:DNA-binding transcriptional ArsR family regulator